jgi:hypothetical protein
MWQTYEKHWNARVNPNKCTFGISAEQLLGFLIHERRIEVGQKSISVIDKIEAPLNKKELQSLIDRINFIRRFIFGLSEKNSAVHNFVETQGRSELIWGEEQQKALKQHQTLSKIFVCPNAPSRQKAVQIIFIG